MDLLFLVPPIHNRPTGGNIYNRRIITELQSVGHAELVPWSPTSSSASPLPGSISSPIVTDSLLLRNTDAIRHLRQAHPSSPIILLAHYLRCIDPHRSDGTQAASERSVLSIFDGAVTTSRYGKRALSSQGIPASRIRVVPPGLDDPYRASIDDRASPGPPQLLTVANVLPGKGLLPLIEMLDTLSDESWRWTLIGDDSLDPTFAQNVQRRLEAAEWTHRITGPTTLSRSALRSTYDRSDIFLLPSRFETCSMAMREAMARALPVVGYDVGGLPENVGDNDAACLVSSEESDAFTTAIRTLLRNPTVRKDLGTAARARSRSFPSWRDAAMRFQSFVNRLASTDD